MIQMQKQREAVNLSLIRPGIECCLHVITQARPEGRSIKRKSLSSFTNIMGAPWGPSRGYILFFPLVPASVSVYLS